jgi:tetratricopeptide (TPR) repeat protein
MKILKFTLVFFISFISFGQDFKSYVTIEKNKFNSSKKANIAYDKGTNFFNIGDYDNAIAQFTITIEDDKKQKYFSTDAYINRAAAYIQINDFTRAINDYSEVINFEKDASFLKTALIGRAGVYASMEDFDKAISDFKKAIDLKLNDVDAFYNLSSLYLQMGDYKSVLEYSLLAENNYKKQDLNNLLLLGYIYFNKGVAKYFLNISSYCDDFTQSIKFKISMNKYQLQFIENTCPKIITTNH